MEVEVVEGTTMVGWVVSGVAFWWTAFLLARGAFPKRSYDFCNRAVSAAHAAAAVSLACLSVADWSRPLSPLAAASSPPQVRIIPTRTTIRTIHTYARWSSSSSSPSSSSWVWLQMKALAVTLSYMVYDAACCYLNDDVRVDNTVHHLVSIVGIAAGLAYRRVIYLATIKFSWHHSAVRLAGLVLLIFVIIQCGTEMVASLFVTEISSPLLHLREILKEFGIKDTDLNLLVDVRTHVLSILFFLFLLSGFILPHFML